jgi:tetratricopeptide (TPR) repeat protein
MNARRPRLKLVAAFVAACFVAQSTAASARAAGPTSVEAAEQLANEAYEAQAAGKYAEAIATYAKAYDLSNAAPILYNIATLYDRKLSESDVAAGFYRKYLLSADAEPTLVKKATERLEALKHETDERAAADRVRPAAPTRAEQESPPPPGIALTAVHDDRTGDTARVLGIVTGAAGLAGLGAGLALGAVAKSKNDAANSYCNGAVCSNAQGVALAQQAGDYATASSVTFVAGLSLIGAGAVLYFLAPPRARTSDTTQITFAPSLSPANAGLVALGVF